MRLSCARLVSVCPAAVVAAALVIPSGSVDAATLTWTGSTSSDFGNAGNWLNGVAPAASAPVSGDTAEFGTAGAGRTTVTLGANRDGVTIKFLENAPSYDISGARVGNVVDVAVGLATNQKLTSALRTSGGVNVNHQGTGTLTLGGISNGSGAQGTVYVSTINAVGNVTFTAGVAASGRIVRTDKTGAGTLAYTSTYDFKISDSTVATIDVQAGRLNTSAMTLVLEALNTDVAPTLTLPSYVLIDYVGAALTPFSTSQVFAAVTNLPSGYQVVNDTVAQQVRLQVIPEPASLALLGLGAAMMLRRRD